MPINSTAGIVSDEELIRVELDSGGELELIVRKDFTDINGEPILAGSRSYRCAETHEQLSGRSTFRCNGCYQHFNIALGKEIREPVEASEPGQETTNQPESPALAAIAKVLTEQKPATGYCRNCYAKEKKKRFIRAITDFFVKPLKGVVADGAEESDKKTIVIVPVPVGRQQANRNDFVPPMSPNADKRGGSSNGGVPR